MPVAIRRSVRATAHRQPILSVAIFATALLTLAAARAEAQTVVNGQIAYVASGPSTIPFGSPTQTDIWVMNADGSNPRNLTNTSDVDEFTPAWSPDGTRIAYVSDAFTQTLTIMGADGGNPTPIATGATFPTWNPAGTEIAYVRGRDGLPVNIVIRTLATGAEREITGPVDFGNGVFIDVDEMEPSWSPTGDRIAFTSVRPEVMVNPVTGELEVAAQYEIVTVAIDGTDEQVVSRGDPGSDRANYLEEDRSPSWSPDGTQVLFMSQAQVPSCCGPWQVWAVNRDGSAATNLTGDDTVNDMYPSWSPDGTRILFTRADATGFNLYTTAAPTPLLPAATGAARAAATSAGLAPAATTGPVTPLTFDGNAQDGTWAPAQPPSPSAFALTVTIRTGAGGGGSVFSLPRGIACGTDCSESYDAGTHVVLFAVAKHGSRFAGWAGACRGPLPVCVVRMDDVKSVTASFRRR